MSTTRRTPARLLPKQPDGCCRWCGGPVKPPRRTWCSQACVDEYLIRNSPQHVRKLLFQRDSGVCVLCGTDTERLRRRCTPHRRLAWLKRRVRRVPDSVVNRLWWRAADDHTRAMNRGFPRYTHVSWWQADHIVPVIEGGGQCRLDGYRTLCVPCHKRVTAELRVKLTAKRRADRQDTRQALSGIY